MRVIIVHPAYDSSKIIFAGLLDSSPTTARLARVAAKSIAAESDGELVVAEEDWNSTVDAAKIQRHLKIQLRGAALTA